MKSDEKGKMQLKCALVLNKFLEQNKILATQNKNAGREDLSLIDNLSKLASATALRPATISSIFNADSNPPITNLIAIVTKLNRSFLDFGKMYDELEEQELETFTRALTLKKNIEKQRKSPKKSPLERVSEG